MDEQKTPNILETLSANMAKPSQEAPVFTSGLPSQTDASKLHITRPGFGRLFVQFVIFLWIATILGFASQNHAGFNWFGSNTAAKAEADEQVLSQLKAEIMVQNHYAAVLLLDQLSHYGDEYLFAKHEGSSVFNSQNKQAEYKGQVEKLTPVIGELLKKVQNSLHDETSPEVQTQSLAVLDQFIAEQQGRATGDNKSSVLQDIQDFESSKALILASDFKAKLLAIQVEAWTAEDLTQVVTDYAKISKSVSSLISSIRDSRRSWRPEMDALERLIKTVDPLFATDFPGSIQVTQVNFANDGRLTLVGSTTTQDSKNFTLISNLIDVLEKSDEFEDVQERNYSKNTSQNGLEGQDPQYQGSFNLVMKLQTNE